AFASDPAERRGWRRVESDGELHKWEAAWGQKPHDWPLGDRVFPPSLLDDPDITFVYVTPVGEPTVIEGGLVANVAAGVIGITNVFTASRPAGSTIDTEALLAECLAALTELRPGRPLVSYATERDLVPLITLGFHPLGP